MGLASSTTITHFESSNHFCAMPPVLSMHKILATLPSSWMPAFSHLALHLPPQFCPVLGFCFIPVHGVIPRYPLDSDPYVVLCSLRHSLLRLRFLANEADNSAHFWSESISPDSAPAHKTTEVFPPSTEETGHECFRKNRLFMTYKIPHPARF